MQDDSYLEPWVFAGMWKEVGLVCWGKDDGWHVVCLGENRHYQQHHGYDLQTPTKHGAYNMRWQKDRLCRIHPQHCNSQAPCHSKYSLHMITVDCWVPSTRKRGDRIHWIWLWIRRWRIGHWINSRIDREETTFWNNDEGGKMDLEMGYMVTTMASESRDEATMTPNDDLTP